MPGFGTGMMWSVCLFFESVWRALSQCVQREPDMSSVRLALVRYRTSGITRVFQAVCNLTIAKGRAHAFARTRPFPPDMNDSDYGLFPLSVVSLRLFPASVAAPC